MLQRITRIGFAGLVVLLSCAAPCHATERMVFAHYMLTNQDYQGDGDPTQELKVAAYEREMREAQAMGVDGFALNAGGWLRETYYIRYAGQMFEAALRLHSGFKLMFSADMCCGNGIDDVEDMMRRFAGNPRYREVYFRHEGRAVLTTFAGEKLGVAGWRQIREDLEHGTHPSLQTEPTALPVVQAPPSNAPLPIFLVTAFFWGGETPDRAAIERGLDEWKGVIDGSFYWGIAGVPGSGDERDTVRSSENYAAAVHAAGKLYMAPVCLQFWGANAGRYYEYSGAQGMRAMWSSAVKTSHPEWVEIITWNDFIEGSYVSPIDDPNRYPNASFLDASGIPLGTRDYFHSHAGATALLPFFIRWYKSGVMPAIKKDAVYFFYRTQLAEMDTRKPLVAYRYGPVGNSIYMTANLTAPADVMIVSGGRKTVLHLPAGSTDAQAVLGVGDPPRFTLSREGRTLATAHGNDAVNSAPQFNNYYYSSGVLRP